MPENSLGSIEWIVVFSFIATAFIYFLSPVLGYPAERRGMILLSLYLLIGFGVLALAHAVLQYFMYLITTNPETRARSMLNLGMIFAILQMVVFIAAQVALVMGLEKLHKGASSLKAPPAS